MSAKCQKRTLIDCSVAEETRSKHAEVRATQNLLLHRSAFERKASPDRDLPVLDGSVVNLPARLKNLEPVHASY